MESNLPPKVRKLNHWFDIMTRVKNGSSGLDTSVSSTSLQPSPFARMHNDMEMYFGDVQGTGTQFNIKQLIEKKEKYDIPISTKINYAIGEQVIAHLVGTKPFPKLIAPTNELVDLSRLYEEIFTSFWTESRMDLQYAEATADNVRVGQGWLHIRRDDFYGETTFGVKGEHIPWEYVYVDPTCENRDLSDADIICIARTILKVKAEKKYDMKISGGEKDLMYLESWAAETSRTRRNGFESFVPLWDAQSGTTPDLDEFRPLCERIFYQKDYFKVWISENGDLSLEEPTATIVPNPQYQELLKQREELVEQANGFVEKMQSASMDIEDGSKAIAEGGIPVPSEGDGIMAESGVHPLEPVIGPSDMMPNAMEGPTIESQGQQQAEQATGDFESLKAESEQLQDQIIELDRVIQETPPEVTAYRFNPIASEQSILVYNIEVTQRKMIRQTVMIGNRILKEEVVPVDEFPLIPLTLSFMRGFDKAFGVTHFVKDLVKGMNKFWSLMIYNLQLSNSNRMLYPDGAVMDPTTIEKDAAVPGSWIKYIPNPALPDGGRPTPWEASSLSPGLKEAIGMLTELSEYSTGINGAIQGNPEALGPNRITLGGLQSLHSMATQRLRLYAMYQEQAMTTFAYVAVAYLQAYAPKGKVITYFGQNGESRETTLSQGHEDLRFKVKVEIATSLSTARQMATQVLASVSGQTRNPALADLLTKHMLENSDIPDGRQIAQAVDTVNMQQQQITQLESELQKAQKTIEKTEQEKRDLELKMAKQREILDIEHARDLRLEQIKLADNEREVAAVGGSIAKAVSTVNVDDKL